MKSGKRNEVWLGTLALMVLTYETAIGGFPDGRNHDVLDAGVVLQVVCEMRLRVSTVAKQGNYSTSHSETACISPFNGSRTGINSCPT